MGVPPTDPPQQDKIFFKNIPDYLAALPHWVLWNWEKNEKGRWTKPLYIPHAPEYLASTADPKTWSSLEVAKEAYENNLCHGVGFVVSNLPGAEDNLVAIDLDGVYDPRLKKITDRLADAIQATANSYTEISPSGTGIRILGIVDPRLKSLAGHKAGSPITKDLAYEIYFHHRYVTITGRTHALFCHELKEMTNAAEVIYHQIEDLMDLKRAPRGERQKEGKSNLSDDEILKRAFAAHNGTKFKKLFVEGDWKSLGYASQSEADFALCTMLAFWTNRDAEMIDRLFRKSALMREKWEREDYRTNTIGNASAGTEEVYKSQTREEPPKQQQKPKPKFQENPDWILLDASTYPWNFPKPKVCVDKCFNSTGLGLIVGQSQGGKTLITTNLVMRMTTGGLWFNKLQVEPTHPIWYLVLEDPAERFESRYGEMLVSEFGSIAPGRLYFQLSYGLDLGEKATIDYFAEKIDERGYKVIIIDTFQAATAGIESFDDKKMSVILNNLRNLTRSKRVLIIIVDHLRKKASGSHTSKKPDLDEIKGTGAKVQNADTVIFVDREKQDVLKMSVRSKDHGILSYLLTVSPIGSNLPKFTFSEDLTNKKDRKAIVGDVLESMNSGVWYTREELMVLTGKSKSTVHSYMVELKGEGKVKIEGKAKATKYQKIAENGENPENDNESSDGSSDELF